MSIYTPRASIDMMQSVQLRDMPKKVTCTVIELYGYEISISMETITSGNLTGNDIQVYVGNDNITKLFLQGDEYFIRADSIRLMKLMEDIRKKHFEIDTSPL
jgi:hypothetical protein